MKKKKKKREEAQKLPEVSKEIFYDVAANLREVLGSTQCDEKPEVIPWDKHDNVEEAIPACVGTLNKDKSDKQEETSGFTFSFFGAEKETSPMKEGTRAYSKAVVRTVLLYVAKPSGIRTKGLCSSGLKNVKNLNCIPLKKKKPHTQQGKLSCCMVLFVICLAITFSFWFTTGSRASSEGACSLWNCHICS